MAHTRGRGPGLSPCRAVGVTRCATLLQVSFKLAGALAAHKTLQMWRTDEKTHFISKGNLSADATGSFT